MPRGKKYNVVLYMSAQDTATRFQLGKHLRNAFVGHSELFGKFSMGIRLKNGTKLEASHSQMLTDERIPIERYHDFIMDNTVGSDFLIKI